MPVNRTKKKAPASKTKTSSTKKAGTKKSGELSTKAAIDGVPVSEMTKDQLIQHVAELKTKIEREQEERNYFQLEKDKIQDFWNVSKSQLEEKQIGILQKNKDIQDIEKKYEEELELHKKRIKFMLHEQKSELSLYKIDNMKSMKSAEESFLLSEKDLLQNQLLLKRQLREMETSYEDIIKGLKLKHCRETSRLKSDLQQRIQDYESKYRDKVQKVYDDMETKWRLRISKTEEQKNNQMSAVTEKHAKDFNDMRNHYNGVIQENVSSIENLQQKVEELKMKEDNLEQQVARLNISNKALAGQLPKVELKNSELQKKLLNYDKDKDALSRTRVRLSQKKNEFKKFHCEMEMVKQRCKVLEDERSVLKNNFVATIQEVQQKCGLKSLKLEEKLRQLKAELEKCDGESRSNSSEN